MKNRRRVTGARGWWRLAGLPVRASVLSSHHYHGSADSIVHPTPSMRHSHPTRDRPSGHRPNNYLVAPQGTTGTTARCQARQGLCPANAGFGAANMISHSSIGRPRTAKTRPIQDLTGLFLSPSLESSLAAPVESRLRRTGSGHSRRRRLRWSSQSCAWMPDLSV
jgi:hypothetical protein